MCVYSSKIVNAWSKIERNTSISNFHLLEVVGRGSETQLEVIEK